MIPWDTFKTPLDAYEWAQANFRHKIKTSPFGPWSTAWMGAASLKIARSPQEWWWTTGAWPFPGTGYNAVEMRGSVEPGGYR